MKQQSFAAKPKGTDQNEVRLPEISNPGSKVLAIGSSTGGTEALTTVREGVNGEFLQVQSLYII